jgi:hypothetical protein
VLGLDDVLLLLTHLWARDTCTFPTEDQLHSLAAILVLSIFTGAWPGELVDATRGSASRRCPWEHLDSPDGDGQDPKDDLDDLDFDSLDIRDHLDDPDYNRLDPWHSPDYTDYDDDTGDPSETKRRYKALCYKDIRLWIV